MRSARYWTTVLNSMKNRGVEDIFIACTDNLTGFSDTITAVFPRTDTGNTRATAKTANPVLTSANAPKARTM